MGVPRGDADEDAGVTFHVVPTFQIRVFSLVQKLVRCMER